MALHLRAGAHHPWSNSRDVNPVARELSPEGIGETDERELARAVGREMGHGHFPADRGDVDDATAAGAAHVRNDLPDQIERRPKMELHRFLKIVAAHVLERADFDDAGVIDQNIKAHRSDRRPSRSRLTTGPRSSRSQGTARASPPSSRSFFAGARQFVFVPRERARRARPPSPSWRAMARPSPREPPVMRTTLPANEKSLRTEREIAQVAKPSPPRVRNGRAFHS